jgi:hypothetical protein
LTGKRRSKRFSVENMGKKTGSHQFESLSKKIIGAAINVHKELGAGFL